MFFLQKVSFAIKEIVQQMFKIVSKGFFYIYKTAATFSDLKLYLNLKQLLDFLSTEYRSTSTQASAPEEHKVDKGI